MIYSSLVYQRRLSRPFLVCAIACRHYVQRPGLYDLLSDIAVDAAGEALVSGAKTVETVQAFLLLAVYPVPKKKWVDDRSWLYMGTAIRSAYLSAYLPSEIDAPYMIRLAQELQLDQLPTGPDEQANYNLIRTWMNCFCVDGSHATQFGKMAMVKLDDYLVRKMARVWYKSPTAGPYDIGLCGYSELLLLMARFRKACGVNGLTSESKVNFVSVIMQDGSAHFEQEIDLAAVSIDYDKQFADLYAYWKSELEADPNVAICNSNICFTWAELTLTTGPVVRYRCHHYSL